MILHVCGCRLSCTCVVLIHECFTKEHRFLASMETTLLKMCSSRVCCYSNKTQRLARWDYQYSASVRKHIPDSYPVAFRRQTCRGLWEGRLPTVLCVPLKVTGYKSKQISPAKVSLSTHFSAPEWFSSDLGTRTGEPNFWSFDWFREHSANACAVLLDFGTCSFDDKF